MISIQNSMSALERCDRLRALTLDCYVTSIRGIAQYAVELDDAITGPHRDCLHRLAGEVAAHQAEGIDQSCASLRSLLRDYHDKAAEYLARLREELAGSAKVLQDLLRSLCQSDGDHEQRFKESLNRLRALSKSRETAKIAAALAGEVDGLEDTLEAIRRYHQLMVSQFLSEIGVLHRRIDSLESAASVDAATKLLRRGRIEEHVRNTAGGTYCLLLVRVNSMRIPALADELAGAFSKRLRNCLPSGAVMGRWGEGEFIAMLSLSVAEAMAKAKSAAEHLSGVYACVQNGKTVRPSLQVSVAVVGTQGETSDRTLEHIRGFFASE
jgi:GGDEF domain-containing protein